MGIWGIRGMKKQDVVAPAEGGRFSKQKIRKQAWDLGYRNDTGSFYLFPDFLFRELAEGRDDSIRSINPSKISEFSREVH